MIKILKFALLSLLLTSEVYAQEIRQPVRIVTNLPVASAPDVIARKMSELLTAKWAVPVIVENKPGATGVVALEYYLNDLKNDPNAILMLDFSAYTIMPTLYHKEKEIEQLKIVWPQYSNYWVVVAPPHIKTWKDLQASAKEKPFYGSWGVGSSGHFCGAEISQNLKIPGQHVAYKEYGVWFGDLANNQLTYSCSTVGSTEQYVKSGRLNWIAITAKERDPQYPDIPTIKELTGRDFKVEGGYVVFFTNTKTANIHKSALAQGIKEVLENPEIKDTIKILARGRTWSGTAEQFETHRRKEIEVYKNLITTFNIKIN